MHEKRFRYQREDFLPFPVTMEHMDIEIRFFKNHVEAANTIALRALDPLARIDLDATDLEGRSVRFRSHGSPPQDAFDVPHQLDLEKHKLSITPPRPIAAGERFFIETQSLCRPSDHILEGIYKDVTPPGAPQQYMS